MNVISNLYSPHQKPHQPLSNQASPTYHPTPQEFSAPAEFSGTTSSFAPTLSAHQTSTPIHQLSFKIQLHPNQFSKT